MSGTVVEELIVKLGIEGDESKIASVLGGLEDLAKAGAVVLGAFTAAAVGVFHLVETTATAGDQAAATAEKLGLTTQALQGLEYAAEMSDTTAEALANGLKFLGKNAAEAAQGSDEMGKAFGRAGVRVTDAHGKVKPLEELLGDVSDRFAAMPEDADKINLAMKLFGRAGLELVPLLNKGSKGIAELQARAQALGVVMSEDMIKASQEFDDSMKTLHASVTGLRNAVAGPFIATFGALVDRVSRFVSANRALISQKLAVFFKVVAGAAGLFLDALEWFVANRNRVEGALLALTSVVVSAAVAFLFVKGAAIASALATAAAWATAALPFILIGTMIALIVDELYTFATGGKSVLGDLIKWFDSVNPEDTKMLAAFKAIGSVIFDLGDPAKWKRVVEAGTEAARLIGREFRRQIAGLLGMNTSDQPAPVKENAKQSWLWESEESKNIGRKLQSWGILPPAIQATPGLDDHGNAIDSKGNRVVTVNAPITFVVPPGTPESVAADTKRHVEDYVGNLLREAGAVAGR